MAQYDFTAAGASQRLNQGRAPAKMSLLAVGLETDRCTSPSDGSAPAARSPILMPASGAQRQSVGIPPPATEGGETAPSKPDERWAIEAPSSPPRDGPPDSARARTLAAPLECCLRKGDSTVTEGRGRCRVRWGGGARQAARRGASRRPLRRGFEPRAGRYDTPETSAATGAVGERGGAGNGSQMPQHRWTR